VDRAIYELKFDGQTWSAEQKVGFALGD